RGRPGGAAAGRRPLRLSHRAGGAHERAQIRGPGARLGVGPLRRERRDARDRERRHERIRERQWGWARARRHARARGGVRWRVRERAESRRRLRRPRPAPDRIGGLVSEPQVKVLIVDDQSLVRAGFRMILDAEADVEVIGEASDGREAVEATTLYSPDVILMDIRMPNLDGLEATRRILDGRTEGPRVLMLTTFDLDEYVYEALRAGASGFLLKDTPPEQLVEAIHVVARGDALLSPS